VKTLICTHFSCCEGLKIFFRTVCKFWTGDESTNENLIYEKGLKYHIMAGLFNIMMYLPCEVSCMSTTSNMKFAFTKGMNFYFSQKECDSSLKRSNCIFIAEC
jgi:hypothetical protein